jgi:hypothetical protein
LPPLEAILLTYEGVQFQTDMCYTEVTIEKTLMDENWIAPPAKNCENERCGLSKNANQGLNLEIFIKGFNFNPTHVTLKPL